MKICCIEKFDLYDFNKKVTGKNIERSHPVPKGFYRLVIHVCVFNSKGKMLIQKRQKGKSWSELWDISVGGHIIAGESSQEGAERELMEELGIYHSFAGLSPVISVTFSNGSSGAFGFDDYYIYRNDIDISNLKLQKEKVSDIK